MRIILSRKGFDSSYGRVPSPILPDGTMVSLPIPQEQGSRRYAELSYPAGSVGTLVSQLSEGRITPDDRAHFDPDLDRDACRRSPGWRPAFGQAGAAARHLDRQGVGVGDLFLFFGWFRATRRSRGVLRYVDGAPDLHVIFGWLKVGRVLVTSRAGLDRHPHFADPSRYAHSRVYAAAGLGGGGVFRQFLAGRQLTEPGQHRSQWLLPEFFMPRGRAPLSFHGSPTRWERTRRGTRLHAVARGQEFVLDASAYPEAVEWAASLGANV